MKPHASGWSGAEVRVKHTLINFAPNKGVLTKNKNPFNVTFHRPLWKQTNEPSPSKAPAIQLKKTAAH